MKPGYWIGIMALVGAVLGYALLNMAGWLDAGIGAVAGILVGAIIYTRLKNKQDASR